MFIRRTKTRSAEGGVYHSYRLVRSERSGERVRQRTLLNLGSEATEMQSDRAVAGAAVELDCPKIEREAHG